MSFFPYIALLFGLGAHPFYVSVCEIDHNPQNHSLEIAIRFFIDDLETCLEEQGTENLRLNTEQESPETERYLKRYLPLGFKLEVNGEPVSYNYLGKEYVRDAVWCYVEVIGVPEVRTLNITQNLLTETFEEQENIVHVHIGKAQKSLRLNKDYPSGMLEF